MLMRLVFLFVSILLVTSGMLCQTVNEGDNYDQFSGCIIQKLAIETYDPAGIRIYDTTIYNNRLIMRSINVLHKHTRSQIISRILRFTVGDTVEPFAMYESERLIRRLIEVRDCFIKMKFIPGDRTRVSVLIVVQDRFSLAPAASIGSDFWMAEMRERNFLGSGHRMSVRISGGDSTNSSPFMYFSYTLPIVSKQLFQIGGDYSTSTSGGYRGVRVSRPLISPLFKWGGGLSYGIRYGSIAAVNKPVQEGISVRQEQREVWIGRAFSHGTRSNRISRQVIVSGAYVRSRLERKEPAQELIYGNASEAVLGSAGFTILHRYRKKQLFSFEQVSDFTEGVSLFLTQGWIDKGDNAHAYSGLFMLIARQFPFGYFAGSGDWGFRAGQNTLPEHALEIKSIYVSPLLELGNYRLRATLNGRFLTGNSNPGAAQLVADNRSENVWLSNNRVFQSLNRTAVEFRLALYTPWKILGADIAPFIYAGTNKLAAWSIPEIGGGWNNAIGIGVIFRHVKLAINVVRISFVFYPASTIANHPIYQFLQPHVFELPPTDFDVPQPHTVIGI
jgi:hypothetical protein